MSIPVDAAEVVGHSGVECDVCEGEEAERGPDVTALDPSGLSEAGEDQGEEEKEEEEEAPELLLLGVYGALLLQGLLEMELHDRVEGLDRRFQAKHQGVLEISSGACTADVVGGRCWF
jgi:hypothetical protein